MFSNKKKPTPEPKATSQSAPASSRRSAPSVISAEMHILGNVKSDGFVDIDGSLEGNINCRETTIRENGNVQGDVSADQVHVYGRVEGLIKAKHVLLHASAHVEGVIMHESLSIEDGAFVDGKFKRLDKVFIDEDATTMPSDEEDLEKPGFSAEAILDDEELQGLEKNLRLIN